MTEKASNRYTWAVAAVLCVGCYAFFQLLYPYHLHHREQIMLFDGSCADAWHAGFVGRWLDGFLTQLFYYRMAGPAIVTAVMAQVWTGVWLLTLRVSHRPWIAVTMASVVTIWQILCQTSYQSTLQPPIALAAITLSTAIAWGHKAAAAAVAILAAYLTGNPFAGRLWSWPDMEVERRLALDSEAYYGNWGRVLELCRANTDNITEVYYHNLANAINGTLPDNLLRHRQIGTEGLTPMLSERHDYLTMNALGELWYRIGAMTDAEHCTMLGLISSPNNTGSRYIRRLAMINLANGDTEAAMKYLRMLRSTMVHGAWARDHMPGHQSAEVQAEIAHYASLASQRDTLHLANDIVLTLRHMHRIAPNRMAYDYLMCLHLLNRNLTGFLDDYDPTMPHSTLYDEALIIALRQRGATADEAMQYNIAPEVMRRYKDYAAQCASGQDAPDGYATTYWYYYNHQ